MSMPTHLFRPSTVKMLQSLICLSRGPPDQAAPFGMGSGRQSRRLMTARRRLKGASLVMPAENGQSAELPAQRPL